MSENCSRLVEPQRTVKGSPPMRFVRGRCIPLFADRTGIAPVCLYAGWAGPRCRVRDGQGAIRPKAFEKEAEGEGHGGPFPERFPLPVFSLSLFQCAPFPDKALGDIRSSDVF